MSTPASRGWGSPGQPGSPMGVKYEHDHIVTVRAGGIKLRVHHVAAPLFVGFITSLVAKGYQVAKRADDWGFAHRFIRGSTSTLSNHAWGLAIDLNATTNPMTQDGKVHTDMPAWVPVLATQWGLNWGGNYTGRRKDPMHFEFLGGPEEVAAILDRQSRHIASTRRL